jgi:hypothetical protein
VRPGTYDEANGEVFPISVPPRVTLVGDEARKGDPNGSPVLVRGGGDVFGPIWGAIVAGSGATIAGLDVVGVDSLEAGAILGTGVLLDFGRSDIVVRNNTFSGAHVGLYVHGALNVLATNNVFTGNNNGFSLVAGTAKVEHNLSTNNAYGFECDTGGADFGGGALGSAGGNTITCNGLDVWVSVGGVSMTNNFWDHVPPVSSAGAGPKDIYLFAGATAPITTGAKLATPACP